MKQFLLALAFMATPAVSGDLVPHDDSYTIAQRYEGYKATWPDMSWPAVEFQAGQQVLFDRLYKTVGARELHADVFLPAPGRANGRGIVLVHGGGWRSGNKSHFYALANRLAQRGYAVVLPEFRLSPEAAYPAGLIDVNDAIVWAKGHAAGFGITRGLALGGASSGGQMAALLAYTADTPLFKSRPEDDTRVVALVDLDGVLDFTDPLALQYENAAGSASPAALWLGGSMEQAPQTWREASAASHVSAAAPPTLVISSGLLRFTAGRAKVEAGLDRFGIRHAAYTFDNAPHDIWLFDPWLSRIVDQMDVFLKD